ncbi:MAG: alpha/beta fold hydrolase [Salinirussus sp.]
MRLRTLLGVAAGTVGATTVVNRLLAERADGFQPILPGDRGTYRWRGFDVAYAELGDPADQDLVLLHGIHAAASGHEYQPVAADLAETFHVLIPDLPGFGHSDRPALTYSASLYETFLTDFLTDVTDEPPIVVASSLTASYAAHAATTTPVASLVLICPSSGVAGGQRRRWLHALIRSPVVGQAIFNAIASKPGIRYFHADHGVADPARYPAALIDYEWRTAHQPGARFAPASFLAGYLDPDQDLGNVLAELDVPKTLLWGRDADLAPLQRGREWAEQADARLVVVDDAKLLPHVEHPMSLRDVLKDTIPA